MRKEHYYYVANWKMQRTFNSAIEWVQKYKHALKELSEYHTIILCPSFTQLAIVGQLLSQTNVFIGAQNCAAYDLGPFTGEVPAASLQEIGCTYCILGHSERRILFHETNEMVAAKTGQLLKHNICPIICVGETAEQLSAGQREFVLEQQLAMIFTQVAKWREKKIVLAYEPVWAIGSGMTPDTEEIAKIFTYIRDLVRPYEDHNKWNFLYGGSVSSHNAREIKDIIALDGLLMGTASLDFQELKKIVS